MSKLTESRTGILLKRIKQFGKIQPMEFQVVLDMLPSENEMLEWNIPEDRLFLILEATSMIISEGIRVGQLDE